MVKDEKPIKYKLVTGPDGSIVPEPYDDDEPDPQPAEDGKYYLMPGDKATLLAWQLYEKGLPVYCAQCRAALKVSWAYIFCPTDDKHFNVMV